MRDEEIVPALSELQVVALTLWGEARGEPIEGRFAVANAIRNRVKAQRASFGFSPRDVCLKAWQFSCWLPGPVGGANYQSVLAAARHLLGADALGGPVVRECVWIADGLLGFQFGDTVQGSTHYLTAALFADAPPAWAKGKTPTCQVNRHL